MKKYIITACSLLLTAYAANAATVAFYDFNGTGTAIVGDTIYDTASTHNGAVAGASLVYGSDLTYGAGSIVSSYLTFAGPDGTTANRVVIPGSADFLFTTSQAYTIETIFRTTQTGTTNLGVMVSKGADVSNPDSQWWLRHQGNGQLRNDMEGTTGAGVEDVATSTGTPLYNDGQWHSMAFVFDGTLASKRLDLYVDGVLKASDTIIGTSGTVGGTDLDPVIFGEFASLVGNRSFAGDLAAVRFSNTALTVPEFLVIPEPSVSLLALVGLGLAALLRRKTIS